MWIQDPILLFPFVLLRWKDSTILQKENKNLLEQNWRSWRTALCSEKVPSLLLRKQRHIVPTLTHRFFGLRVEPLVQENEKATFRERMKSLRYSLFSWTLRLELLRCCMNGSEIGTVARRKKKPAKPWPLWLRLQALFSIYEDLTTKLHRVRTARLRVCGRRLDKRTTSQIMQFIHFNWGFVWSCVVREEAAETEGEIKCHFIVQPCHNLVSKISTAGLQLVR